jgi:hypothetical protein
MHRFGRLLRNLLLFALVGWAGVDDYFPAFGSLSDSSAEIGDSVLFDGTGLFDGAGSRRFCAADDLSPSAFRSRLVDRPIGLLARVAALGVRLRHGTATSDHLYALMSLRR